MARKSPLNVAFVAPGNPKDVRSYSGVPHFTFQALQKRFDRLTYIDLGDRQWTQTGIRLAGYSERIFGRRFVPGHGHRELSRTGRKANAALERGTFDAAIVINGDYTLAYIDSPVPVIHSSDTTFAAIADYYPSYCNLWSWSYRRANELTAKALRKASYCTFPSEWAARSARDAYGVPSHKVRVVPYGANLKDPPRRDEVLERPLPEVCQFLFIGRAWERKGGDVAFETMLRLLEQGVDARMVAVGCDPGLQHSRLRVIPFLNKQVPEDLETYVSLWRSSAFLFMPSRQETFGAIYAEAAANGLPVIARDTGGVSGGVQHGVSGLLLAEDAGPASFADEIAALWSDPAAYRRLAMGARDRFEGVLNWDTWAEQMAALAETAASAREEK